MVPTPVQTIVRAPEIAVPVLLTLPARTAAVNELTLFAGSMQDTEAGEPAYAWQLDYRHWMAERFAFSVSYLNEGHVPYHHRDGGAVQAWTRVPVHDPRLSLAGGVGPYYYFDSTQPPSGIGYANEHGWGVIGSLELAWFAENRLVYHLRGNVVRVGAMDTQSVLLGVGYQLDVPPWLAGPPRPSAPGGVPTRSEITVLAGRTIVNSYESEHALAGSIEYRRRLGRFVEGTVALLDEGKNDRIDRSGGTVQLWLVKKLHDDRASIGIGGGGYYARDREHLTGEGEANYFLTGIASLTASYRIAREWSIRATWSRVHTHYHRDTDLILLGPAYLF
jgi:hypothetical protein